MSDLSTKEKAIDLFSFLMELIKIEKKQKPILSYEQYDWKMFLSDIPENSSYVQLVDRNKQKVSKKQENRVLLSVRKPEFESCPVPPSELKLVEGWDDFRKEIEINDIIKNEKDDEPTKKVINTTSDNKIVLENDKKLQEYTQWLKLREKWVKEQKNIEKIRNLFNDLFNLYFKLENESGSKEIIIANGILLDKEDEKIQHPVLTRRVKLNFDVKQNVISIVDTEAPTVLYTTLFQNMQNVNLDTLGELSIELQNKNYHPLDREKLIDYFTTLVNLLSTESQFSEKGIPENWKKNNRFLLYLNPCFIVRSKLDSTEKTIEKIIENIKETGYIPEPIIDIIGNKDKEEAKVLKKAIRKESLEEQLAAVSGENANILLTKAANKEQLDIVKNIEQCNAILVQGPPGTGKTHTISNLIGHFLAQGKTILVTSKTNKALNVLKEKVVPGLQDLCVSVLDDSNTERENAIDNITQYVSKTSTYELEDELGYIREKRLNIISELNQVRQKIHTLIKQEHEPIKYNGEKLSPIDVAKYVAENETKLGYIPGNVKTLISLPLNTDELTCLYQTNKEISIEEEEALKNNLPDPQQLVLPAVYKEVLEQLQIIDKELQLIQEENNWEITYQNNQLIIKRPENTIHMSLIEAIEELSDFCKPFERKEEWIKYALLDGSTGFRNKWYKLIEMIQETCKISETLLSEQISNTLTFKTEEDKDKIKKALQEVKNIFEDKGKITTYIKWFNKNYKLAQNVMLNGKAPETAEHYQIIIDLMNLEEKREECAKYWDEVLAEHNIPKFYDLDKKNQEYSALKWIEPIQFYLKWHDKGYEELKNFKLPLEQIINIKNLELNDRTIDNIYRALTTTLPEICKVQQLLIKKEEYQAEMEKMTAILIKPKRKDNKICRQLLEAIQTKDNDAYSQAFILLKNIYLKMSLFRKRQELLEKLKPYAPEWAKAIEERQGIHGEATVPHYIEDAWKWKQYATVIEKMTKESLTELQKESIELSKNYKAITAEYTEKLGWYHLLKKNEFNIEMKQALQGWKQTFNKIEEEEDEFVKESLKAKAQKLMSKCQEAVPCWIMRIDTALESFNPKQNKFDIIIIDEASQVDISALAVLYMGKKMIIVGDDKQVSPMAVGIKLDKVDALRKFYIEGKIPNDQLYNLRTSIYDLALTTFPTIVLREHFRCVPEIIGYSNHLSYSNMIKPLRESGKTASWSPIKSYKVKDGERKANTRKNPNEAKKIVELLKECIKKEEYKGKTFGIISLLGDKDNDQVKEIEKELNKEIEPSERIARKILCGNATSFQGDERDVIFLSMVDSNTGKKALNIKKGETNSDLQKRYNVAASRAKDQLWIVHSLDVENDLKEGDIRKGLLDYANHYSNTTFKADSNKKLLSKFETTIYDILLAKDYNIIKHWQVGIYTIDLVVKYDDKKIAIKCHDSYYDEARLKKELEEQFILESLGWHFIQVRGSEFYRNCEKTVQRIQAELMENGIYPKTSNKLIEKINENGLFEIEIYPVKI